MEGNVSCLLSGAGVGGRVKSMPVVGTDVQKHARFFFEALRRSTDAVSVSYRRCCDYNTPPHHYGGYKGACACTLVCFLARVAWSFYFTWVSVAVNGTSVSTQSPILSV